jgi:hypothetical protein
MFGFSLVNTTLENTDVITAPWQNAWIGWSRREADPQERSASITHGCAPENNALLINLPASWQWYLHPFVEGATFYTF